MSDESGLLPRPVSTENKNQGASGSESAPSYNFTDSTNTGMFYDTGNSALAFTVSGSTTYSSSSVGTEFKKPVIVADMSIPTPSVSTNGYIYKKPGNDGLFWNTLGTGEVNITVGSGSGLTAHEEAQVGNIDTVTISNTQWGYLGALDQGLTSTSTPTFASTTTNQVILDGDDEILQFSGAGRNSSVIVFPTEKANALTIQDDVSDIFIEFNSALKTVIFYKQITASEGIKGPLIDTGSATSSLNYFGYSVAQFNKNSIESVAIGNEALVGSVSNNNGVSGSVAIGYRALYNIYNSSSTEGYYNTAVGSNSLGTATTGQNNVAIGKQSGGVITNGAYNTMLGTNTSVTTNTDSYSISLGANAVAPGTQKMRIGGTSSGTDNITEITVGIDSTCNLGTNPLASGIAFLNVYSDNFLPFTGSHVPAEKPTTKIPNGVIMSSTDKTYADEKDHLNAKIYVEVSKVEKDATVIGIAHTDARGEFQTASVGEGTMLAIVEENGDGNVDVINNGDYICSSGVNGYGCKQGMPYYCNFTVAKAITTEKFESNYDVVNHNGKKYRKKLIPVIYLCG